MRISIATTLAVLAGAASAASSSWGFSDGQVQILSKGADSTPKKYAFTDKERIKDTVKLGFSDKIKVTLTAKEGSKAKRPHQAFLLVREASGLEAPYAFTVKDSGKGSVEFTQKDIPIQLLTSSQPLEASLVLGSFGTAQGSVTPIFDLTLELDPNAPAPTNEKPLRYGKQPEIHHIFRAEPKNPPKIVSIVFALAVLATIPALVIGWGAMGANVADAQKALSDAPISHITFFGSIISMEGVFFLYYSGWSLFATLPIVGVVGVVAFLSGTKALGEVQNRRLAGRR